MSQFIVDKAVATALSRLREPTCVADAQGRVLGVFTPSPAEENKLRFDLEEAERISREEAGQGRPLREFWADIRAGRPIT